jgi:hypothetical protein
MAYFLFVDESGTDGRSSQYEVLAGLAVEESRMWPLITQVHQAEVEYFGHRLTHNGVELKGGDLLKRKVFNSAARLPAFATAERRQLTHEGLLEGAAAKAAGRPAVNTQRQLVALAQAKLAFVDRILELAEQAECSAFASMVVQGAPRQLGSTHLRKDYAYLLERFYYLLEHKSRGARIHNGFLVLDELDQALNTRLRAALHAYFRDTVVGRERGSRLVPEPFIVHSDLTTLVQVTDVIAYVIAWGLEIVGRAADRPELRSLADRVLRLGFTTRRRRRRHPFTPQVIYPFYVIDDLRPAPLPVPLLVP